MSLQLHAIRTATGYAAATVHGSADVTRVNEESRRQAIAVLTALQITLPPQASLNALWQLVDQERGQGGGAFPLVRNRQ